MEKTIEKKVRREDGILSLFGPSKKNVPMESVVYIRKNPKRFIKKITEIYGVESVVKWVGESI